MLDVNITFRYMELNTEFNQELGQHGPQKCPNV